MNPQILLLFFISSTFAVCPKGTIFNYQFNKCYKHISEATSFILAEKNCESMRGSLVSISNVYENIYIADLAAGESSDQFWIGLNFLVSPQWTWIDRNPSSYRNWAPFQPQNQNLCGAVSVLDNQWRTVQCYTALPYVCQIDPNAAPVNNCPTETPKSTCPAPVVCPTPEPVPVCPTPSPAPSCPSPIVCPTTPPASTCPPPPVCPTLPSTPATTPRPDEPCPRGYCPIAGYTLNNATCKCYKYGTPNPTMAYFQSEQECAKDNATLAIIRTEADNNFIRDLIASKNLNWNASMPYYFASWIGLYCAGNSTESCRWADGTSVEYSNFREGWPHAYEYTILYTTPNNWITDPAPSTTEFVCQTMGIP